MIRRAELKDVSDINRLLNQVLDVHHVGRPDLFKGNTKKYTDEELKLLICDDSKPIFVYEEDGKVTGYAFCVFICHKNDNILTDIKTLYIDDLCVDENRRGNHIGKKLYEYVLDFAKKNDCYNLTLNVWALNNNAMKFYEALGMKYQKICMETIL